MVFKYSQVCIIFRLGTLHTEADQSIDKCKIKCALKEDKQLCSCLFSPHWIKNYNSPVQNTSYSIAITIPVSHIPWVPQLHWYTWGNLYLKKKRCVLCAQSCHMTLWDSHGLQPTRLLCPWNSLGKNTGVVCHFLLQRIFLTQGLKTHFLNLLYWQVDSFTTEPLGKPEKKR